MAKYVVTSKGTKTLSPSMERRLWTEYRPDSADYISKHFNHAKMGIGTRVALMDRDLFGPALIDRPNRLTSCGVEWCIDQIEAANVEALGMDPETEAEWAFLATVHHIGTARDTCLRNNCPGCITPATEDALESLVIEETLYIVRQDNHEFCGMRHGEPCPTGEHDAEAWRESLPPHDPRNDDLVDLDRLDRLMAHRDCGHAVLNNAVMTECEARAAQGPSQTCTLKDGCALGHDHGGLWHEDVHGDRMGANTLDTPNGPVSLLFGRKGAEEAMDEWGWPKLGLTPVGQAKVAEAQQLDYIKSIPGRVADSSPITDTLVISASQRPASGRDSLAHLMMTRGTVSWKPSHCGHVPPHRDCWCALVGTPIYITAELSPEVWTAGMCRTMSVLCKAPATVRMACCGTEVCSSHARYTLTGPCPDCGSLMSDALAKFDQAVKESGGYDWNMFDKPDEVVPLTPEEEAAWPGHPGEDEQPLSSFPAGSRASVKPATGPRFGVRVEWWDDDRGIAMEAIIGSHDTWETAAMEMSRLKRLERFDRVTSIVALYASETDI